VSHLPPEDQPDVVWIGPVGPIPVYHDDDPRLADDRAAWSAARKLAQAMITADELLEGLTHPDWRVRHDVVERLVARAGDDERMIPALLVAVQDDPYWQVRDAVIMALRWPDDERVQSVLRSAQRDPHEEVQWSANYKMTQFGMIG
jgi:HEAT repeat protein